MINYIYPQDLPPKTKEIIQKYSDEQEHYFLIPRPALIWLHTLEQIGATPEQLEECKQELFAHTFGNEDKK